MITNREWLESLTNKQLAQFLTSGLAVTNNLYLGCPPCYISIRGIAENYTQSTQGVEKWLSMPQQYCIANGWEEYNGSLSYNSNK